MKITFPRGQSVSTVKLKDLEPGTTFRFTDPKYPGLYYKTAYTGNTSLLTDLSRNETFQTSQEALDKSCIPVEVELLIKE